ncbi:MAG: hypothetical protein LBU79_06440 [Planctomycetota bacterium]|jgi:predicted dehydrogenase|nr:hypothetical protein [Planctomycetota bacterium]
MARLMSKGCFITKAVPKINYQPAKSRFQPRLGLIGCSGEASFFALTAYIRAGYNIEVIYDPNTRRANEIRNKYLPSAEVADHYGQILADPGIDIVDMGINSPCMLEALEQAIRVGKHVHCRECQLEHFPALRQIAQAGRSKALLAICLPLLWSPGWRYLVQLVRQGYIGQVESFNFQSLGNRRWTRRFLNASTTPVPLANFSLPWFNMVADIMGGEIPLEVSVSVRRPQRFPARHPTLVYDGKITYSQAVASLNLSTVSPTLEMDRSLVVGDRGIASLDIYSGWEQKIWLARKGRICYPEIHGDIYPGAYHASMAELIQAVSLARQLENSVDSLAPGVALLNAALNSLTDKPRYPEVDYYLLVKN